MHKSIAQELQQLEPCVHARRKVDNFHCFADLFYVIDVIFTTVSTISMPRIGRVSWNWYSVDPNTDEQEIRKRPKEQKIKTYPSFDVLLF